MRRLRRGPVALALAAAVFLSAGGARADGLLDELGRFASFEAVGRTIVHRERGDPRDPLVRNELQARARLALDGRLGRLRLVPRLEVDDGGLAGRAEPFLEDGPERPIFTFEEAYATAFLGPLELTAGKRIYSWGRGLLYRPTNLLNPLDLVDPPLARYIGVVAADAFLHLGEAASIEGALIPFFVPGRLPEPGSRWFPIGEPLAGLAGEIIRRDRPPRTFETMQGAVRATLTLGGFDLAATYFDGFDGFPRAFLRIVRVPLETPRFELALRWPRLRAPGLAASTTLGDWEVHAEAAWNLIDPDFDESFVGWVAGAARRFEGVPLAGAVSAAVEYADAVRTREARANPLRLFHGARVFDNVVLGSLAIEPRDWLRAHVRGWISLERRPEGFVSPAISYVKSNFEASVGLDLFFGPEGSDLGRFEDDARLVASVKVML